MRTYLATLHRRSHNHKKRFALVTSLGVTLLIFSIWSLVRFGDDPVVAKRPNDANLTATAAGPLSGIRAAVYESWKALEEQFGKAKSGLESVDIGAEYYQVRNEALNQNGR